MKKELIERIAMEVLDSFKSEANDPNQTDRESVTEFAARFLARIDAERGKEAVAIRTFDGEGGYDYRGTDGDDTYIADFDARNPNHVGWAEPLFLSQTIPEGMALVRVYQLEHAGRQAKIAADCIVGFSKAKPGGMCGWLDDACTAADIAASDIRAMLAAAQGERK